jgi:acetyltransferase-like isoleucine patch superfamily enzyme
MGALILNTVSVGAYSVVGAGAVVTRDVPDHVQVVGVPAEIVKEGVEGK